MTIRCLQFGSMAPQGLTTRERAIQFFESLAPGPPKPGEATQVYQDIDRLAYALSRVPTFTPRPVKIVAIGAGFSGVSIARAVHTGALRNAALTVYEKDAGVGGTWYENRYPGYAGLTVLLSPCPAANPSSAAPATFLPPTIRSADNLLLRTRRTSYMLIGATDSSLGLQIRIGRPFTGSKARFETTSPLQWTSTDYDLTLRHHIRSRTPDGTSNARSGL